MAGKKEGIVEILGKDAEYLLGHVCNTVDKTRLSLPGPDFVDRVFIPADRSIPVLRSLECLFTSGRLAGSGYLSILPVDQDIEHSAGSAFGPNPEYFDPENVVRLAVEAGCNGVASTLGILGMTARKYAHKVPYILKLNHNELLTYPEKYDQILFATIKQAWNMGAVVVDEAVRHAMKHKGVAVVTIPVDYGFVDIPDRPVSAAANFRRGYPVLDRKDVDAALKLIEQAERPVLYVGQGARGGHEEILAMSEQFSMPIVTSVLAKGIVPDSAENLMGTAARVASKPANETLAAADLIVFAGSNFPFARFFFPKEAKFIQIDCDSDRLGSRHKTDAAILGDATTALRMLTESGKRKPAGKFLAACRENMRNWKKYLHSFDDRDDVPLRVEPVFKEINRIAEEDAIFITDVGNSTIHAVRHLDMNPRQRFTTSGLFATMGYGVPGGIAAKLGYPDRQVFTLNGDGAFAMVMQDIITQAKYRLPVINVVFSNDSFGFIEAEQEDAGQTKFGVDLQGADYAKAGEAMGAKGFSITKREQLAAAFDEAKKSTVPVVIDVKIENKRPFPAEAMMLDKDKYGAAEIDAFKERYEVGDMPLLKELLK